MSALLGDRSVTPLPCSPFGHTLGHVKERALEHESSAKPRRLELGSIFGTLTLYFQAMDDWYHMDSKLDSRSAQWQPSRPEIFEAASPFFYGRFPSRIIIIIIIIVSDEGILEGTGFEVPESSPVK